MRQVSWTDADGRRSAVLLPDDAPDSMAPQGVPVGPPDLGPLRLPLPVEIRLHNQLHDRAVLTAKDAKRRRQDIEGALRAALKLDSQRIVELYEGRLEGDDEAS